MVPLKDIVPAAQNIINTQFILLEKDRFSKEGKEKTCLALVADETAAVHFQLWGSECDAFEPGDIICLTKGIFSYHRNNLVLRAGKRGKIEKIGEFTMAFVETPNLSEIRWVPDPSNLNKLVQEVVVSHYSFFSHRLLKLFSRMAKSKGSIFIRLVSTAGTGFFYVKRKNPRLAEKLEFRKYDPRVNCHVLFKEEKMK